MRDCVECDVVVLLFVEGARYAVDLMATWLSTTNVTEIASSVRCSASPCTDESHSLISHSGTRKRGLAF